MKKKIKICIIQLTRFGDLIQTIQAISNYSNFNNLEFSLIGRKDFTEPLKYKLTSYFKNIYQIDLRDFFSDPTMLNAKNKVHNFIEEVNQNEFDLVVNLTFSKASAYLAKLIKSKTTTGLLFNNLNQINIADDTSRYFYTNVNDSIYNSTQIVDLYKQIIGLNSTLIHNEYVNNNNITIHPFTSKSKKEWNVNKWTEVIYKILKDNPQSLINLIGSKSEKSKSDLICNSPILQKFISRLKNHTGQCNIEQTEQVIQSSSLFIGHDSLNSHLAALNNIKTIIISLGSSRVFETSPYVDGAIILSPKASCYPCHVTTKCDDLSCHQNINYQAVVEIVNIVLKDGSINSRNIHSINIFNRTNLIIHQTSFLNGSLVLEPIIHFAKDENLRRILTTTWQYYLYEKEMKLNLIDVIDKEHFTKILDHIDYIYELTQFGKKYSEYIIRELADKNPNIGQIKEYSNNIDQVEKLFVQLTPIHPELSGFINYFKFERANLKGKNIVEISEQSYLSFQSMEIFIKILFELTNSVLVKTQAQSNQLRG